MNLANEERKKYTEVWSHPQYSMFSPGEFVMPIFKQLIRKRGSLIDIGCGTGRAGAKLQEMGWNVTLMDLVTNCLEPDLNLPFIKQNLWSKWKADIIWDYGYCCDVMEHIPPEKVKDVLNNIFKYCDKVFLSISFNDDEFGKLVGSKLHLTIEDFVWWKKLLSGYGKIIDARDLLGMGVFYVRAR